MGCGQELEEYCRVDGQVPAHTDTPQGSEDSDSSEIGTARRNQTKYSGRAQREIKRPFPAEDVAAKTPECGPKQEADVLREG